MNMWAGIVAVVAIVFLAEIIRTYIKARGAGTSRSEIEALQQRIDELNLELRDRIETLERIVTDDKADLKRQFDRLDKTG
jgi:hypothetical protein